METEVHGHPPLEAAVGKGSVQQLAVADDHVARITNHGHRPHQSFAARLRDQLLDVELPHLVGTRKHPDPIDRSAPMDLGHEIESVDVLVELRALPMGHAVLMPGDRGADSRLLDEERFVEGNEVRPVDRLGDPQEFGMGVDP